MLLGMLTEDFNDAQKAAAIVTEIQARLVDELEGHLVLAVKWNKKDYYGQEQLFGEAVALRFPDASFDIKEAGNCYAVGRYTACVFHLMRALEIGLGVFGTEFGLTLGHTNWHPFIEQIESRIRDLGKAAKTSDEKTKHEFYAQTASSFMFLKDAWRNHTAHARGKYTEEEAETILRNVRSFMQKLAGGNEEETRIRRRSPSAREFRERDGGNNQGAAQRD